jgi:membrane protein required for colicin V production
MSVFDIVTGIILLFFFLKGLKNGFIIELASLSALILGIIIAVMFSEMFASWISGYFTSRFVSVLSFFLIFIGVVILVHLFAKLLDNLIKAIALGWFNRLAGAAFGLVKSAFLVSAIILAMEAFGWGDKLFTDKTRTESYLFNPLHEFAPATLNLFNINFEHLLPTIDYRNVTPDVIT